MNADRLTSFAHVTVDTSAAASYDADGPHLRVQAFSSEAMSGQALFTPAAARAAMSIYFDGRGGTVTPPENVAPSFVV
jgi:hypothetical protein